MVWARLLVMAAGRDGFGLVLVSVGLVVMLCEVHGFGCAYPCRGHYPPSTPRFSLGLSAMMLMCIPDLAGLYGREWLMKPTVEYLLVNRSGLLMA